MNYQLLGNQIRKYRKNNKLTLEVLAEKLGVSTTFIGQIERGKGIPSLETFVNIANTLEVSTDSLLYDSLDTKSVNTYFVNQLIDLTEKFTSKDKELILKYIELFKDYKENNK